MYLFKDLQHHISVLQSMQSTNVQDGESQLWDNNGLPCIIIRLARKPYFHDFPFSSKFLDMQRIMWNHAISLYKYYALMWNYPLLLGPAKIRLEISWQTLSYLTSRCVLSLPCASASSLVVYDILYTLQRIEQWHLSPELYSWWEWVLRPSTGTACGSTGKRTHSCVSLTETACLHCCCCKDGINKTAIAISSFGKGVLWFQLETAIIIDIW